MAALKEFVKECESELSAALDRLYPGSGPKDLRIAEPPSIELGELSSSISFELAKRFGGNPFGIAERLAGEISPRGLSLISSVEAVRGYVNFRANYNALTRLIIEEARSQGRDYGKPDAPLRQRVLLEHTSVNPVHPIHIGQARNPVLGDSLARLLRAVGNEVSVHFYIDDTGRQSAIAAYGYQKLGRPKPKGKPDKFIGEIYAITSCLLEVKRLERIIKQPGTSDLEGVGRELEEWRSIAKELEGKYPETFAALSKALSNGDPEVEVEEIIRGYERGEAWAREIVRPAVELCLEGFKETLAKMGICFDSWDWESDLLWSGRVAKVLGELSSSPYVREEGGALILDANRAVDEMELRTILGIGGEEVPPLTLTRSDGTSLYTTRDIAYSLWKFERADRAITVIGSEQSLAQLHLRIALCILGKRELAERYTHFAYGLVELPGHKMSSRRGRAVSLDEVLDEAVRRARQEVLKRSPALGDGEIDRIAQLIGVGAVKYALASVEPNKNVTFAWDRVVNFETNSAPFLQYAHARACNILKKAESGGIRISKPSYELLSGTAERELIIMIGKLPMVVERAAERLAPDLIANYANELASKFNYFYDNFPVIKSEPEELRDARLALVDAFRIALGNALHLLGIEAPGRM
ncbi:MAG: arginine--tRNA ligase [Candidatus Bathyarchaeia archaeon]